VRHELDLRGIACPLSWATARVHLERLAAGTEIDLLVDDPRSARDVPRAAEAAGHHVVEIMAADRGWKILVEV